MICTAANHGGGPYSSELKGRHCFPLLVPTLRRGNARLRRSASYARLVLFVSKRRSTQSVGTAGSHAERGNQLFVCR